MKNALYLLLLLSVFSSCKKYRCPATVYCSTGYNFVFVAYDTSELSTYVLRVYKGDNTFSTLIDSATIKDTLVQMTANGPEYVLLPLFGNEWDSLINGSTVLSKYCDFPTDTSFVRYDWEIYIPKASRTYRITGINPVGSKQQTVETCDPKGNTIGGYCYLQFGTYTVDGRTYNGSGFDQQYSMNMIFLKK